MSVQLNATLQPQTNWQIIKDAVNNAGHLTKETKLSWNDWFLGSTDYIDGIFATDLTHPIMRGKDPYGRKFFCFRVIWHNKNTPTEKNIEVFTIFERYTNNHNLIATSSRNFYPTVLKEKEVHPKFQKFINGKTIEIKRSKEINCFQLAKEIDKNTKSTDSCLRIVEENPLNKV